MDLPRSASWGDIIDYIADDADSVPSGKKLRRLPIDRALHLPSTRFENSSRINRVGDAVVEGVSKGTKVKVNKIFDGSTRFPKIEECAHFHYDEVELGKDFKASVLGGMFAESEREQGPDCCMFSVRVSAKNQSWLVYRSYEDFRGLDRQVHRCIFDRRFSRLPQLPDETLESQQMHGYVEEAVDRLNRYLTRLCPLAGSRINCGPLLNWFEIDSKGHHLQLTSKSGINVPAIAAAQVVQQYVAQDDDELSLKVGEIVSIIDMPPETESNWWRGKAGFQVGFFPRGCVEVIGDQTVHQNTTGTLRSIKQNSSNLKPVVEKHGKMLSLLRTVMKRRPTKEELQRSGIVKSRVFGADLGEHLENTNKSVPLVIERCAQMIEKYGVIEGVYRLPGISSNINRLRQSFDAGEDPDMETEQYLGDIQCVASLCKMYFRELPNPLFTYQLYDAFEVACRTEGSGVKQLEGIAAVMGQLPPPHLSTAEFLVKHLARLASHSSETKMTAKNLSIVWAPNLMKPQDTTCSDIGMIDIASPSVVVQSLINNVDWYFGEPGKAAMASGAGNRTLPLPLPNQVSVTLPSSSIMKHVSNDRHPLQRRSKTTDDIGSSKLQRKGTIANWKSMFSFGRKSLKSYDLTKGRPSISGPVGFVGSPPAAVLAAKDLIDAGPTNVCSHKSATLPPNMMQSKRSSEESEDSRLHRQMSPVADAFSGAFTKGSSMAVDIRDAVMTADGTAGFYKALEEDDVFDGMSSELLKATSIDSPAFNNRSQSMYELKASSPPHPAASRVHSTDIDSYMASMFEATKPPPLQGGRLDRTFSHDPTRLRDGDGVEYTAL